MHGDSFVENSHLIGFSHKLILVRFWSLSEIYPSCKIPEVYYKLSAFKEYTRFGMPWIWLDYLLICIL